VITLSSKQVPSSKAELTEALNEAVGRFVKKSGPLVTIQARVFPYLDEIAIDLDGAELNTAPPPFSKMSGETKKACEAHSLNLSGRNIKLRGLPFDLQMSAHDIVIYSGSDENGQTALVPHSVGSGHIAIAVGQKELEKALGEFAREEGAKHGISIDDVRIALRARGARSISADIHLHARKFLLRTEMDVSGQLEIDDSFEAKISNLKCRATGAIGAVVCGVLQPHLDRLEGRSLSLMTLPIGRVQLRDVRVTVADTVEATADFAATGGA
jgi:hypothetical protein